MYLHHPSAFPALSVGRVAVVGLLLIATGCAGSRFGDPNSLPSTGTASSTASPAATADPSLGQGLTEAEAIDAARDYLSTMDQAAPVWATLAGTYEEVFASLAHRPIYVEQPPPANPDELNNPVWGIQFHVTVEICGPAGTTCETRDGLVTVLIDYATGEKLRMTTYAPSPGEPLPSPLPATD